MNRKTRLKVLIAKPGLDGHDKGAKRVVLALRDAGMEVIYTGLHQSLESIVPAALQEGVDVIGLSIMSGAHLHITRNVSAMMREAGLDHVRLVVGGVIPCQDIKKLEDLGVDRVFPGGTPFDKIVDGINRLFDKPVD